MSAQLQFASLAKLLGGRAPAASGVPGQVLQGGARERGRAEVTAQGPPRIKQTQEPPGHAWILATLPRQNTP